MRSILRPEKTLHCIQDKREPRGDFLDTAHLGERGRACDHVFLFSRHSGYMQSTGARPHNRVVDPSWNYSRLTVRTTGEHFSRRLPVMSFQWKSCERNSIALSTR